MNKIINLESKDLADYYSVGEAAKFLGITTGAVRNYLCLGKMTTYKFKEFTLLSKREVKAWKR